MKSDKTFKREVAITMTTILLLLYLWGILGNPVALVAAESLKVPVFMLLGGAFGLDAIIKGLK